jgi:ParB/RepB/Spo0J family partition protein
MNLSALESATKNKTRTTGISPFMELELSKVYPNPEQPRKDFKDIHEFALALKQDGLLQPIVVVKKDDGYMIVSGERRFKAHQLNKALTIKSHVIQADEHKILELSLIENIQRDDLTDYEVAIHISKLWLSKKYACKRDLSIAIGKSQSYLSKAFGCLNLHDDIRDDLQFSRREIGLSVLEEISRVKDKDIQKEVYDKYLNKEITRDDIKEYRDAEKPKPVKQIAADTKKSKEIKKTWNIRDDSFDEDDFSWYSTDAFFEYFLLKKPNDFPEETTPQRYKITIEEV